MRLLFVNRYFYPDHSATSQMLTDLVFGLQKALGTGALEEALGTGHWALAKEPSEPRATPPQSPSVPRVSTSGCSGKAESGERKAETDLGLRALGVGSKESRESEDGNLQPSTFNLQPDSGNGPRATGNRECSTFNVQRFTIEVMAGRQLYDDPEARLKKVEEVDGVRIRRVWSTRFGRGNLVLRAVDYASFYLSLVGRLLLEVTRGDTVVLKTDPPLLSVFAGPAVWIKRGTVVNWIQDLFPEAACRLGVLPGGRLSRSLLQKLRNWSLRRARTNVVIGEGMREVLASEGVNNCTVIHNWADGSTVRPVVREENPLRREWELEEAFVVGYSGNLGRAHEFGTILGAASRLRSTLNVERFTFEEAKEPSEPRARTSSQPNGTATVRERVGAESDSDLGPWSLDLGQKSKYNLQPSTFNLQPESGHGPPAIGNGQQTRARRPTPNASENGQRATVDLLTRGQRTKVQGPIFLFIGDGSQKAWIEREVERRGLEGVVFRPYQPRERLAESLSVADVHLVSLNPDLEGLIVPSKFYGILAAGRPVFYIGDPDGELAEIIRREGIGRVFRPGDGVALAETISELAGKPEVVRDMGDRARRLFEREYELPLEKWASILDLGPWSLVLSPEDRHLACHPGRH